MLALEGGKNNASGIAFLVSAGIVYEIIAKDVSSPQTAELNAEKRAPTLMKWVHVGQVEAAFFVAAACLMDRKRAPSYFVGGILAMVITEAEYLHAKSAGLKSNLEPTESW